ncbi:MAG: hypothetical protein HZC38_15750 [Chloroflexi bacterium]|nr:hypothetical protein [Chloroflexota bacterium]MBI5350694.1 hypothetical protein [Chloroflexota bacterium]MBI5714853.1 hypothetical protein [Chloroflexota bacterium]
MPTFNVSLVRSFIVTIDAKSSEQAARLAELYLGYMDESNVSDRKKLKFQIQEIEMTQNDAVEIPLIRKKKATN